MLVIGYALTFLLGYNDTFALTTRKLPCPKINAGEVEVYSTVIVGELITLVTISALPLLIDCVR